MNIQEISQLGGTVITVLLFLNYLIKRDNKLGDSLKASADSDVILAKALQRLTDMVERNSSLSAINTNKIDENVVATDENTKAIKETNGNNK